MRDFFVWVWPANNVIVKFLKWITTRCHAAEAARSARDDGRRDKEEISTKKPLKSNT